MAEKIWGVCFNERSNYQYSSRVQSEYPDWMEKHHIQKLNEQGLVVWNNIDKKIEVLNGSHALKFLNDLTTHETWKSEGVSVTRLVSELSMTIPRRGRRKKAEQQEAENNENKPTFGYKEVLHLPPEAGQEIIDLINENKITISRMAEWEKERFNDAIAEIHKLAIKLARNKEVSDFNFSAREFQWKSNGESRWVCKYQITDGYVCMGKDLYPLWCACIKQHNRLKNSKYFNNFSSAIEWVEKEIVDSANQIQETDADFQIDTEQRQADNLARLQKKLKDGPYWINSLDMEPKRISYKILIYIDTIPTNFKALESKCGDILYLDKHFLSASKLAFAINLEPEQFDFCQPAGPNSEWHLITSLTTFYQETSAAEQSQKIWGQSKIIQQFKEGKIRRACYGYREVETGFEVYLGACEDPKDPWPNPIPRKDHMEQLALRESISFSLNITDFRDFLGISTQTISDNQILKIMHATRARSKHLPEEIKLESKVWLAQYNLQEERQ